MTTMPETTGTEGAPPARILALNGTGTLLPVVAGLLGLSPPCAGSARGPARAALAQVLPAG